MLSVDRQCCSSPMETGSKSCRQLRPGPAPNLVGASLSTRHAMRAGAPRRCRFVPPRPKWLHRPPTWRLRCLRTHQAKPLHSMVPRHGRYDLKKLRGKGNSVHESGNTPPLRGRCRRSPGGWDGRPRPARPRSHHPCSAAASAHSRRGATRNKPKTIRFAHYASCQPNRPMRGAFHETRARRLIIAKFLRGFAPNKRPNPAI